MRALEEFKQRLLPRSVVLLRKEKREFKLVPSHPAVHNPGEFTQTHWAELGKELNASVIYHGRRKVFEEK